jgi:hypothetical protein
MLSFLNSDQFQIGPATIGLTSPHSDVSQVCRWTRMSKSSLAFVIVLAPWILGCAFESSRAATIAPHPPPPHVAPAHHPPPPPHVAPAPHPQPAPVTKESIFVQPLHTIQNSNFGNQPAVAGRVQKIAEVARNLPPISTGGKTIASIYSDALTNDFSELGNVARAVSRNKALGAGEETRLIESLDDVHSDLSAKTSFAQKNPSDPSGFVNVKVLTHNNDNMVVRGYNVWYSLTGSYKAKDENHYFKFDRVSSPTSQRIPPGNYTFWTAKDTHLGPPEQHTVGADGQQEMSIDLPTP